MKKTTLDTLLFLPELKSLAGGKSLSNLGFLIGIYVVSLFSLGSGQQVQQFLREQMDDPYVKLIATEIPQNQCKDLHRDIEGLLLNNKPFRNEFRIDNAVLFKRNYILLQGNGERKSFPVGSFSNESHPIWEMLSRSLKVNDPIRVPFGAEAVFFSNFGLRTIVCGPGSMQADGHQPNKGISMTQLTACLCFLQNAIF